MTDVIAHSARGAAPGATEMLWAAHSLHDLIDGHAEDNDRRSRIAEPVVDRLHEIGAIGALTPRALGGGELTPRQAMDLFRILSYADPATGWTTFALSSATGIAGAFLDRDTAEELFTTPRLGVAGQGTRPGQAVPVTGGYLLSGKWSLASGIKHATHAVAAAIVADTGQHRCFILPVDRVTLVDNWDVLGLRGTGSIDYQLRDTFVPANYSFATANPQPVTGGILYRIGLANFASINHGAWATGVGRRLLDEVAAAARDQAGYRGASAMSDTFAADYAAAEIKLRAAKAFLYEVWEEIEDLVAGGERVTPRLDTLSQAALNNAIWRIQEIADFVYVSSGTTALHHGTVQRFFRDAHAGTQHITASRAVLASVGRDLTGLAAGHQWMDHMIR